MAQGRSFESFGKVAKCGKNTLYQWLKAHEEFQDAFTRARAEHLYFMETKALDGLVEHFQGPKMNTALFKLFMVNIHGWRSEPKEDKDESPTPIPIAFIPIDDRVKKPE
jgi:hypothetical protein